MSSGSVPLTYFVGSDWARARDPRGEPEPRLDDTAIQIPKRGLRIPIDVALPWRFAIREPACPSNLAILLVIVLSFEDTPISLFIVPLKFSEF